MIYREIYQQFHCRYLFLAQKNPVHRLKGRDKNFVLDYDNWDHKNNEA